MIVGLGAIGLGAWNGGFRVLGGDLGEKLKPLLRIGLVVFGEKNGFLKASVGGRFRGFRGIMAE